MSLSALPITPALKSRISSSAATKSTSSSSSLPCSSSKINADKFVLYLPTVNLRKQHNPAFALACHLANEHDVQLVVLCVVLDDASMPTMQMSMPSNQSKKQVVMTSRRLAFILEALSETCKDFSDHGAGVAIRVHGPKARSPDHLTLSSRALAVVTDEPFVNPFLSFVQKIEKTCSLKSIPCYRVDGSCTVPPGMVLTKTKTKNQLGNASTGTSTRSGDELIYYTGVSAKAWLWQKKTESKRGEHLKAAMRGEFDAPPLTQRVEDDNFFLDPSGKLVESRRGSEIDVDGDGDGDFDGISSTTFPQSWRDKSSEAPGVRPWTVTELQNIFLANEMKQWAMDWPGADKTVEPCPQTIGTPSKGMQRWNHFVSGRKGLIYYARRRTDPVQPHASSRMSCYLNFGIVSIFQLVHEVKVAQKAKVSGADKFEEEIVKWREFSYAHSFSRGDYFDIGSVPSWANRWIESTCNSNLTGNNYMSKKQFDVTSLEAGTTGDENWDAMQQYLVNTGELHNNCRMTWGKQLVHWGVCTHHGNSDSTREIMQMLGYLNDRFALDGLSPPSYGGLLWCLGWGDKPGSKGGVSKKPASRYKKGPSAFRDAESILMNDLNGKGSSSSGQQTSIMASLHNQERKRKVEESNSDEVIFIETKRPKTLHHFFGKNGA